MKTKLLCLAMALVLGLALVSAIAPAKQVRGATTWYVNPGESIQAAVDAASPGDTIIVRDGTYTENVDVNKDYLTIRSDNGAGTTLVQAANRDDHVFGVTADYVYISGFTVKGASGYQMAGIFISGLENNVSNNNVLMSSYGIYIKNSSNTTIESNSVDTDGIDLGTHGIYLDHSNNNIIAGNSVPRIHSTYGGIYLYYSEHNSLVSNTISSAGGICLVYSGNNALADNIVCSANLDGWGIDLVNSGNNTLTNSTISSHQRNFEVLGAASHNWWKFDLAISYTLLPSKSILLGNQRFL